jgi:hypothetical protein
MSIKAFHFLFVVVSILLCGFLTYWGIAGWRSSGSLGQLAFGGGAMVAGAGLLVYGRYVMKKLRGMSYL